MALGVGVAVVAGTIGVGYLLYKWYTKSPWTNGVRTEGLGVAVPPSLRDALAGANAEKIRDALTEITTKQPDATINDWSARRNQFNGANWLKTSNWASGGAGGPLEGLRTLNSPEVEAFFVALFEKVRDMTASQFSRADLFHGHITRWGDDVVIVFHAKEYPRDVEERKSELAAQVEGTPEFDSTDPAFRFRNAMYSFRRNEIDALDTQTVGAHAVYGPLIRDGHTLAEERMGDPIAGINYFPREDERLLFLK